jgi:hypothetical protein
MFKVIDPSKVKIVDIKGAKISIGTIPYQKFLELRSELFGADGSTGAAPGKADEAIKSHKNCYELCRWGVKGHKEIVYEDGQEAPFKTAKGEFDGKEFTVVSDETLQLYSIGNLYISIAGEVLKHNMLSDDEAKN